MILTAFIALGAAIAEPVLLPALVPAPADPPPVLVYVGADAAPAPAAIPPEAAPLPETMAQAPSEPLPETTPEPSPEPAPEAAAPPTDPDALGDADLRDARGGAGIVLANQTMIAVTTGNVIAGSYTAGPITISDNALSSFNGLGNILINSGGQVSVQAGMNVTINLGR